jgi:type II secretory pathway component PulF
MPCTFPPVYRGLVRIGERIGNLDDVFVRLAKYLSDAKLLREKLASAMVYPLLVLSIAAAGVLMVIFVVLPNVRRMFEELGQGLPQGITDVTRGMHTALWLAGSLVAAGAAGGTATVVARSRSPRVVLAVDRILSGVPVLGQAIRGREVLNFTFAMETLTESGVQVEDALEQAAAVMGNAFLRREVEAVREQVLRGVRLSAAFAAHPAFPRRVASWVAIGERTGSVGEVFGQIREYYQGEVEKWATRFMSLVEPALIVLVGLVVVFIVLVFIVPLFSLYGSIL